MEAVALHHKMLMSPHERRKREVAAVVAAESISRRQGIHPAERRVGISSRTNRRTRPIRHRRRWSVPRPTDMLMAGTREIEQLSGESWLQHDSCWQGRGWKTSLVAARGFETKGGRKSQPCWWWSRARQVFMCVRRARPGSPNQPPPARPGSRAGSYQKPTCGRIKSALLWSPMDHPKCSGWTCRFLR